VGLLFEQGVGKTWIAAAIIEQLWQVGFEGLVVVPLSNKETTWLDLLQKHFTCYTDWKTYRAATTPKLFIAHYEALPKQAKKFAWSFVCYDESQRLKQRTSKTSKTASLIGSHSDKRLILTGTPLEKRPQDIWAQMRFIAPWVLGHIDDFEDRWLEPITIDLSKYKIGTANYQRMFIAWLKQRRSRQFLWDKLDEFLALLRPYLLRVDSADVLSLPAMTHVPAPVELLGAHKRLYDDLEQDFVTELHGKRITAGLKAVRIGKLQQVCGGWIKNDDGTTQLVGRSKIRKLRSIIKREPGPYVIACRYVAEVQGIAEVLRANNLVGAELYGKVKKKDRPEIQRLFQDGRLDFFVCQQRTGGVGIDLFRSCTLIMYSYTFSLIDWDQMIKRVHRRGQVRPVKIFSIFAKNTVDEDINLSLIHKHKVVKQVLTGLKRRKWQSQLPSQRHLRQRPSSTASMTSRSSWASSQRRRG
jgi:SNF2 family DNA or RNA helicase